MIRTLQKKFTVTAMIAVTVLLVLLLGGINLFNALSVSRDSDELLAMIAAQEDFGPAPMEPQHRGEEGGGVFRRNPDANDRMSALTFSVRFTADGELDHVDLERIAGISEAEAEALGREALESGKTAGRIGSRKFRVVQPSPETRTVVFLDLSRERQELGRIGALSGGSMDVTVGSALSLFGGDLELDDLVRAARAI